MCMMYVLMKGMREAKTKQQNYQTSVNNVILMSAKTVLNDIIPAVNQKGNILCDIFVMKVAFYGLYLYFSINILPVLKSIHGVRNGLQLFKQFCGNFLKLEIQIYILSYNSAFRSLNSMSYSIKCL